MGKDKNKHKKHTKDKKHKKKERRSPSVSSSSSEEWVEKVEHSSYNNTNENRQARDEWMSLSSSFNTTLSSAKRSMREENRKIEKEEGQYNPKKNVRELNPYWKDGGDGLPNFKKPTERDSYEYSQKKYNHSSSWRKRTINDEEVNKCSKHNSLDNNTTTNVISNKDLNVLAAKLVKAELLGNTALAEELKIKLDEAKKILENTSNDVKDETNILLTTTDARGMSRPLKSNPQHGESSGSRKGKKQKVETHVENKRTKYFADDDKYSLQEMFENEKYETIDKQNREFMKIASKAKTDLDDFFVDEIRKKDSDKKNHNDVNQAINTHKLISKSLDTCNYCLQSDVMNKNLMISMGTTIYLSVPYFEPITENHCLLLPIRHVSCATQLDENEWAELMTFRKSLCNMFNSVDKDVIFFETILSFHRYPHMVLECVPVPKEQGDLAPIYFKKAIDESETEWSSNKKLVSLSGRDVRRAIPKGLPYFSVSFGMTEGYAHVIEDEKMFPRNFAQEIIGGMLDLDHSKWRKPKRQNFEQQNIRVQNFMKMWSDYDCTTQ